MRPCVLGLLCGATLCGAAGADVRLAGVFGHDMLIQRDGPIPVWGWADPGEEVSIEVGARRASTVAGTDGAWSVVLPGLPAPGPYVLTAQGKNRVRYDNLAAGDLWIAAGDLAMQAPLHSMPEADAEIARASHPDVRFFLSERAPIVEQPRADALGRWIVSRPETVKDLSATAYHFACSLRERTRVPVGVVVATWGRSPCEAWLRLPALAGDERLAPLLASWERDLAAGAPRQPSHPGSVFDSLIAPLTSLPARGAIFWQGEADVGRAAQYEVLFPALIRDWRAAFGREDLAFLFVQLQARGWAGGTVAEPAMLAASPTLTASTGATAWGELRAAQAAALALPDTAMVVALDVAFDALADRRCREIGVRLAAHALEVGDAAPPGVHAGLPAQVLGSVAGPRLVHHERRADELALCFAPGTAPRTRDGAEPRGFAIAGSDRVWRWAAARIEGDSILLAHPEVSEPVAARHGWWEAAPSNVADGAGNPLGPLRTDDWP